ncbi:MAG: hypothetical protein ACFFD1_15920 [Candidatus Thorarchaeota archaeon]
MFGSKYSYFYVFGAILILSSLIMTFSIPIFLICRYLINIIDNTSNELAEELTEIYNSTNEFEEFIG